MRFSSRRGRRGVRRFELESLEDRCLLASDLAGQLYISEFSAANVSAAQTSVRSSATAQFGETENYDWIELQNVTNVPIDLGGTFLSDDRSVWNKWPFPTSVIVPAGGYLLVYASGHDIRDARLDSNSRLHTNFKLSLDGEFVGLFDQSGEVVHQFRSVPHQQADVSYGIASDGQIRYLHSPSPAAANGAGYVDAVADTKFSVDRGYFSEAFSVAISTATPNAVIRYTLDGSQPSANHGSVYSSPIRVDSTTTLRAAAFRDGYLGSDVDTQTYLFLSDVLQQPATVPGFPSGGRVDVGNRIFVPQDQQMDPVVVSQYQDSMESAFYSIPTISLTSDPGSIFSESGWYDGDDVELPISVEFIYPDSSADSEQFNAGIESHSHNRLKRSLRLTFREAYGDASLKSSFFKNNPLSGDWAADEVNSVVLRAGNNRSWARIFNPDRTTYTIDEFSRITQMAMSGYGMPGNFAHLYINGVYWGLYNPVERADASWNAEQYGGAADDWFTMNHGGDLSGQDDRYDYLTGPLIQKDMSNRQNYAEVQQYLDVQAFADYIILACWTSLADWPKNNFYGANRNESSELGSTPFRYFAWDSEWSWGERSGSMGHAWVDEELRSSLSTSNYTIAAIWHSVRHSDEFMTMFADRVDLHLYNGGALSEANALDRWEKLNAIVYDAVIAESARWGDALKTLGQPTRTRDVDWQDQYNRIAELIVGNDAHLISALRNEGYYPPFDAPRLSQHGGPLSAGAEISFELTSTTGQIYYTLDGADPRDAGGAVSSGAKTTAAEQSIPLGQGVTRVKARVWSQGQWSALTDATFVADAPDVGISEIMYHPAAPTRHELDLGFTDAEDFEFIELHNRSSHDVPLTGMQLVDGVQFGFDGQILPGGQRGVVVRNQAAFVARYGNSPLVLGQYDGTLANGGERIRMLDAAGGQIADFEYDDDNAWPLSADGAGASLELVFSTTDGRLMSKHDAWRASLSSGGSPGVSAATPVLVSVERIVANGNADQVVLFNSSNATIDVSGWQVSDSADELDKFKISAGTTIRANSYLTLTSSLLVPKDGEQPFGLSRTGEELWLTRTANGRIQFVDAVEFGASQAGVSLQRLPRTSSYLVPTQGLSANGQRFAVAISEIHYAPNSISAAASAVAPQIQLDDLEFIEITNRSGVSQSLRSWRIRGGVDFQFDDVTLADQASVLVVPFSPTANPALAEAFRLQYGLPGTTRLFGPYDGKLKDAGELLRLQKAMALFPETPNETDYVDMDVILYNDQEGWPAAAGGQGFSLQRKTPAQDGSNASSWQALLPTPNADNGQQENIYDLTGDNRVDAADIDRLCAAVEQPPLAADLNGDGRTNLDDLTAILKYVSSFPGDANLDGRFNSTDLVMAFAAGSYEDGRLNNSSWNSGDWNCDREFDTRDLVSAFQSGSYSANVLANDVSQSSRDTQQPIPASTLNDVVLAIRIAQSDASEYRKSERASVPANSSNLEISPKQDPNRRR